MNKALCIIICLFVGLSSAQSQCECTDCPVTIPNNDTESSFLDISGATNNTLGQSGQELCLLCIELVYDAIQELDMVLIAPSGDEIDLMINTGLAVNDNITFEICFVPCNSSANPDSGFPAVFDTDAGYLPNNTYDGTYYPAMGCFEDLTGSVNGTWELEMTDNVFADNGDLLDWYMVFTDDSGLDCANADECSTAVSCLADGGFLNGPAFITECEGDPSLDLDLPPTYNGGSGPPAADYDYTYVIADANTDIVEDITMDTDLTGYPPGAYQICGLSYLIDDEPLLPTADGSLEVSDIEDDIDDGSYCADLSSGCTIVVIEPLVTAPTVAGPLEVCAGVPVTWEITDYDPSLNYLISIGAGSFSFFTFVDNIVTVEFISGPGEICFIINSVCGDEETCLTIDVLPNIPEYEILGDFEVCPGDVVTYDIDPDPGTGEQYIYTVTGGVITGQTTNSVTVEWDQVEGTGELCVELDGAACEIELLCEEVDIELDYELPSNLDSPDELCVDDSDFSSISSSSDIISYTWTVSNLNILSGEGTNALEYEAIGAGLATVCLEIETGCGVQGPVCDEIDVFETPEPDIIELSPSCELVQSLEVISNPLNDIDWFLLSGPDDVVFNPDDESITSAEFLVPGIYEIAVTESNDACEATDIIEVEILSELQVDLIDIVCDLDYNYTVEFEISSGTGPYTVNGIEISSTDYVSDPIVSEDDYSFEIIDAIGCSFTIEGEFECPCITDSGSMDDELLVACIEFDELITSEWNEDAVLDNDDIIRFYLHDGDDDELGNIIAINSTGEFEYIDLIVPGQTYYISAVAGNPDGDEIDLDDDCLSVSEGQPIIFYELPELDLTIEITDCSNTAVISGDFDESILSIEWTQVDGPGTSIISDDESVPTSITVSEFGSYSFEYQLSNAACFIFEEIDIEFNGVPAISNPLEDCNGSSDFYVLSFSVEGGSAPYSANIPGQFTGNVFNSDPIPTGDVYNVVVTDSNGCASLNLTGQKLCDCNSSAGNLATNTLSVCGTVDSITVDSSLNFVIESNDIGIFYLYDDNTLDALSLIDSSYTGAFGFNPSFMFVDSLYYVVFAVANELNGSPDPEDPCFDISNAQIIVWNGFPEVNAGADIQSCNNEVALQAQTSTPGSWIIVDQVIGSNPIIENTQNANSAFEMDIPGEYVLVWTASQNNCSSSDTVMVRYIDAPQITNVITSCNDDLTTFSLELEFGADTPYTINGVDYADGYTLNDIPADQGISFTVENVFGCEFEFEIEPIDCSCQSSVGTSNTSGVELCQSEIFSLSNFNNDFIIAQGDTLVYIFHDGDQNNIGNIIQVTDSDIAFSNDFIPGQEYFVTALVGPILNNSFTLSDPCSQLSEGISLIWLENTNVNFDSSFSECIGSTVDVPIRVDGILPVELIFENEEGESIDFDITEFNSTVSFDITELIETWTLVEINGRCVNEFSTALELQGIQQEDPEFETGLTVCNNPIFGSSLQLERLFSSELIEGEWDSGNVPLSGNVLDFTDLPEGSYNLIFSTIGFQDPCPGNQYNVSVTVIECICPELFFEDQEICNSSNSIVLSDLDTNGFEGDWTNANIQGNAALEINNNDLITLDALGGNYIVTFEVTDQNFPIECENIFEFELLIEEQLSAGSFQDTLVLCSDAVQDIDLFDLLTEADTGGSWIYNGSEIDEIINSSDLNVGLNEITYSIEGTDICSDDNTAVFIALVELPEFDLSSENVLCFGEDNGSLSIIIEDDLGQNIECFLNDILQEEGKLIEGLSPGQYDVYISNGLCDSDIQTVIIEEPEPVSISLGNDQSVNINEEVTITAITNLLESDINSVTWSDLSNIIGEDVLQLRESFEIDAVIIVEITDMNGCVAIDELLISVITPDLYIPNVFDPNSLNNNRFGIQNPQAVDIIHAMRIYDRWGNLVFENLDISPESDEAYWDGFYNGQEANIDVYVYMFDVQLRTGERRIYSGDITLIR